ncbi:MAG: hypothetical protein DRN17_07800 [Thermoplasmata archaeon]|nr:MAG: hypothetical protein DRN17_07800 [Thermoplasmata archaeon]
MNVNELNELDAEILKLVFPNERARSAYIAIYENALREHRTKYHTTTLIEIIKQSLGILRNTIAGEYLKYLDSQGAFWHPDSQNPTLVVVKPPHELVDEKRGGGL